MDIINHSITQYKRKKYVKDVKNHFLLTNFFIRKMEQTEKYTMEQIVKNVMALDYKNDIIQWKEE